LTRFPLQQGFRRGRKVAPDFVAVEPDVNEPALTRAIAESHEPRPA
jgi:hypothetical protein